MDFVRVTSIQMNLWPVEHFFPHFLSRSVLKWGKKCSTGRRFICSELTSYKIHILVNVQSVLGNLKYTPDFLGFQFRVILNLCWIPSHAVVVFVPEPDFLLTSASTYYAALEPVCCKKRQKKFMTSYWFGK